jgi:hypothetical protein
MRRIRRIWRFDKRQILSNLAEKRRIRRFCKFFGFRGIWRESREDTVDSTAFKSFATVLRALMRQIMKQL